jgi:hypothetical protein
MKDEQFEKAMAEFLAKGGVIQQAAYRESGRIEGAAFTSPWGAKKKAGRPSADDALEPPADTEEDE